MHQRLRPLNASSTISVVICTRNRYGCVLKCMDTVLIQTRLPNEVVVVDSSDNPALEQPLQERNKTAPLPIRYLRSRPGLTLQRNVGVECTGGDIVVFLDDDVALEPEYIAGMVEPFCADEDGRVGGVQGSFLGVSAPRLAKRLYDRAFMLPGFTGLGKMQASGFPSYIPLPSRVVEVDMICGGNTAYRREVFQEFRFNEELTGYAYMEDDDFSYQVSRKYRLVQTPKAQLTHYESPASRDSVERRQRMDVLHHGHFVRRHIGRSFGATLAFAWSEMGLSLLILRNFGFPVLRHRLLAYRELFGQWNRL